MTTYFQYSEGSYRQKHGCAMGLPVSSIVAYFYMEEVESSGSDMWTTPGSKSEQGKWKPSHINGVNKNIKFTCDEVRGDKRPLLDCAVQIEKNRGLNIELYSTCVCICV